MFLKWEHVKIVVISIVAISHCSGVEYDSDGDSNQLIFKTSERNATIAPKSAGQIRFEDDAPSQSPNYSDIEDYNIREPGQPFKFQDNDLVNDNIVNFQEDNGVTFHENYQENNNGITFQEGNNVISFQGNSQVDYKEENGVRDQRPKKKKKRRKRKPRVVQGQGYQQFYPGVPAPGIGPINPYTGVPVPGNPGGYVPEAGPVNPYPGYGLLGRPTGQYHRPGRRPKPSFAADALAAVTGALSSIAQHDNYQCVPRLLCEAAGGSTGPGNALQSVANLQPLLTLLSAYSGVSSSPLFVFGRAVFLGMTSKGNTASCRYAYPQCPTDPEQLVHYLNNHNGGFFRYFNNPQLQNPQNVEQFYNQLSAPNQYGLQPTYQQPNQYPNYQLNPGLQQPIPNLQNNLQSYDFHENLRPNDQGYYGFYNNPQVSQFSQTNQLYGLYNQHENHGSQHLKYGFDKYHNSKYSDQVKRRSNDNSTRNTLNIQRRIQNRPYNYDDEHAEGNFNAHRLVFSHNTKDEGEIIKNTRGSKSLKFPDNNIYDIHPIKHPGEEEKEVTNLIFPESTNKQYNDPNAHYGYLQNEKLALFYQRLGSVYSKLKDYNNYEYNENTGSNNKYASDDNSSNEDDGLQTVYIVRGNGDPNKPEIVRIRPGEKIN